MSNPPFSPADILGGMSKHRIPRWINVCWLVFFFGLIFAFVAVGLRRSYDLVQIVGFLTINSGIIFILGIAAGLALYGLSILLEGIKYHRTNCDDDDPSGYSMMP
jgi:hypothetical protein